MRYVAFLRGINVGGRNPVKMAELRAAFEGMGFTGVRTVQASGNVVFEAAGEDVQAVARRIGDGLKKAFGSGNGPADRAGIGVVVRRLPDLQRLVDSEPFAGVAIEPATRLYVTFLSNSANSGTGIGPGGSAGRNAHPAHPRVDLVQVTEGEVLTAITLAPDWGTPDLMAWLEKEFGSGVTTRNWNTMVKVVAG
jgi:uncharacterized protein (DUF1697 family)